MPQLTISNQTYKVTKGNIENVFKSASKERILRLANGILMLRNSLRHYHQSSIMNYQVKKLLAFLLLYHLATNGTATSLMLKKFVKSFYLTSITS